MGKITIFSQKMLKIIRYIYPTFKRGSISGLLFLLFFSISVAQTPPASLQQGFSVYQVLTGGMNFSCQNEC
ncbi:MAG: hypothetical protein LBD75_06925, partial [Candidatus Peribacteria bacterium]|nr:hypothetical protein [Candidatus Peribacteria bacterium]